uniref:Uncharacterized protein n=1 Tax=Strigamia maritima TaxID=126957 RepID=T1JBU9_STRMM
MNSSADVIRFPPQLKIDRTGVEPLVTSEQRELVAVFSCFTCFIAMALVVHLKQVSGLRARGDRQAKLSFRGMSRKKEKK